MLSNVSFGQAGIYDKPNFTKPQTYVRPTVDPAAPAAPEAPKKKSKAGKVILGLAAAAVAVVGLLVAGNKTGFLKNIGKHIPDAIKNASWLQWAKNPAKTASAGMDRAGGAIADIAVKGYNGVKGLGAKALETVKGWFGKGTPAA